MNASEAMKRVWVKESIESQCKSFIEAEMDRYLEAPVAGSWKPGRQRRRGLLRQRPRPARTLHTPGEEGVSGSGGAHMGGWPEQSGDRGGETHLAEAARPRGPQRHLRNHSLPGQGAGEGSYQGNTPRTPGRGIPGFAGSPPRCIPHIVRRPDVWGIEGRSHPVSSTTG